MISKGERVHWLTTRALAAWITRTNDAPIKVNVGGILVPITDAWYDPEQDLYVLELDDGDELRRALAPVEEDDE